MRAALDALPAETGVYLMKDRAGRILYVGKARNLRSRVRSYFEGGRDGRAFVPLLPDLVADVETIVVDSDKEALLLEHELIKRHRPRFNVKLRDGSHFIYLRLDIRRPYPRLEVVRRVQRDGARYFGPYPAARALRETLRVINRHFQLRTCSSHDPRYHRRPCLLCQISNFPAPSVFDVPPEEYRRHVEDAVRFLEGKTPELIESLRERMRDAARTLHYEEAARLRDRIAAVERTLEPQWVVGQLVTDQDVFHHHREGADFVVYALFVRGGRVIGGRVVASSRSDAPEAELLGSTLNLYYAEEQLVPDEVLLPVDIEDRETLAEVLTERRGAPVRLLVPAGGARGRLLRMSERNARQALRADLPPPRGPVAGPGAGPSLEGSRR